LHQSNATRPIGKLLHIASHLRSTLGEGLSSGLHDARVRHFHVDRCDRALHQPNTHKNLFLFTVVLLHRQLQNKCSRVGLYSLIFAVLVCFMANIIKLIGDRSYVAETYLFVIANRTC